MFYSFADYSVFIIVLMTFERFYAVWKPFKAKQMNKKRIFRFNPDNQILKLIPEPTRMSTYYGLIGCKLQKPIKDLVSQLWVFRYVSALTKIQMGHTRGKYNGTILFGGQTVNYQDVMTQGLKEKEDLEKVEKIGPKKAEDILKIIESEYE